MNTSAINDHYQARYMYELARYAGVSLATFRKWIKATPELVDHGYTPGDRLLPPSAVKYMCEKYVIHID